jgi:hypothetical protein
MNKTLSESERWTTASQNLKSAKKYILVCAILLKGAKTDHDQPHETTRRDPLAKGKTKRTALRR